MDKSAPSSLFANDGSFMERFKQLQEGKDKSAEVQVSRPKTNVSGGSTPVPSSLKIGRDNKRSSEQKPAVVSSGGKLAFSLKQKSKLVAPVKLSEDDDEDETDVQNALEGVSAKRQKLGQLEASGMSLRKVDVAPPSPNDPAVKKAADRLASFVAKKGRQIEDITRQKNPGDTPFRFLFDENCTDYKYYEYRIWEEEKALAQTEDLQTQQNGHNISSATSVSQRSSNQMLKYQTPASALYDVNEGIEAASARSGESDAGASGKDPLAMMEYYMKKAAAEEKKRPPKQSRDEMPPPASLQASSKRGHHMGDYIPPEELESFMARCNDAAAQKAAKEAAEKAKIQADNVGHKLLSKMGWKEGEGLGSSRKGIADPIMAGNVKKDHLGVGAQQPGEVTPEDDIYEQYKKRMMLGYRHRPNPLNNPRKAYY